MTDRSRCGRSRCGERGAALFEALVALALVGVIAGSVAAVATLAARAARGAARLERAIAAAETVLARLSLVPYAALPETFGASRGDMSASIATGGGGAPSAWDPLLDGLPAGVLDARLDGLGADGAPASFEAALALRTTVSVRFTEDGRTREVEVLDVRF